MPNHSDYLLYGIESPINEKVYYVELFNFFKKFEKHTGLKIKFAAHPKTDKKKIKSFLDNSLMLVTALSPKIGYDNAAKIAKKAHKNGTTLKEEALKSGLITEKEYNKIVDPKKMIKPY